MRAQSPSARTTSSWRWAPVPLESRSSTPVELACGSPARRRGRRALDAARAPSPARRPARRARKSIRLPSMPRSAARILLSSMSSVGYSTSRLAVVVELRRAGARAPATSAASATVCSTRVCWSKHARLDRAQLRVRAHVPPQERVVLDRAGAHHQLDAVRVDLPGPVVGRDAPRAGRRGRSARATTSSRCPRPPRRASSTTARAAAAGSGGSRRRRRSRLSAPSIATWTWVPKMSSGLSDPAELARSARGSAGGRRSPGPSQSANGCVAAAPISSPRPSATRSPRGAASRSSRARVGDASQGLVAISSTDFISSGLTWPETSSGTASRSGSISCARSRLSASSSISSSSMPTVNGGPVEFVLEHSGARASVLRAARQRDL